MNQTELEISDTKFISNGHLLGISDAEFMFVYTYDIYKYMVYIALFIYVLIQQVAEN